MTKVSDMYIDSLFSDVDDATVKTPDYKARLYTRGEFQILGAFGGTLFYADIDTPDGKYHMEFVVSEQIRIKNEHLSFSKN
jgi:hypothetical protein